MYLWYFCISNKVEQRPVVCRFTFLHRRGALLLQSNSWLVETVDSFFLAQAAVAIGFQPQLSQLSSCTTSHSSLFRYFPCVPTARSKRMARGPFQKLCPIESQRGILALQRRYTHVARSILLMTEQSFRVVVKTSWLLILKHPVASCWICSTRRRLLPARTRKLCISETH